MDSLAPWNDAAWWSRECDRIAEVLAAVGRSVVGPVERVKAWGRSAVSTVPTADGPLWIKHSYRLPPGEELVLGPLASRHPGRVPAVVTQWSGAVVMEPLPPTSLEGSTAEGEWTDAARALGELATAEASHVESWIALGVRDRRPPRWRAAVENLLASPEVLALEPEVLAPLRAFVPEFIDRYETAFRSPASLVPQDSGDCNIRIGEQGPVLFDWADVVVGHPVYSCDRLLDQVPEELRRAVIDAFREPLDLSEEEFAAVRRSNVLHEVLRYHDELAYLGLDDPVRASLAGSVRSQLRVLVEYESRRKL